MWSDVNGRGECRCKVFMRCVRVERRQEGSYRLYMVI